MRKEKTPWDHEERVILAGVSMTEAHWVDCYEMASLVASLWFDLKQNEWKMVGYYLGKIYGRLKENDAPAPEPHP